MLGISLALTPGNPVLSGPKFLPETTALVARFTTPPSALRKQQINTLIGSLKTAGVWAKLDALYIMAAADAQAARRNWVADAFNPTAVSSPSFTADRGYNGDGAASRLDTGFNPATAGGKFSLNSATYFIWLQGDPLTNNFSNGNLGVSIRPRTGVGNDCSHRLNNGTTTTTAGMGAGGGFYASRRVASTDYDIFIGATKTNFALASSALSSLDFTVLARQISAGSYQYSPERYAVNGWGSGMTDAEILALRSALSTYLTAIGAA